MMTLRISGARASSSNSPSTGSPAQPAAELQRQKRDQREEDIRQVELHSSVLDHPKLFQEGNESMRDRCNEALAGNVTQMLFVARVLREVAGRTVEMNPPMEKCRERGENGFSKRGRTILHPRSNTRVAAGPRLFESYVTRFQK